MVIGHTPDVPAYSPDAPTVSVGGRDPDPFTGIGTQFAFRIAAKPPL